MRFYFLFVSGVLAILLTQTAFACDVCGSFMGITPYDNQSGITLLHRYRLFSKIDVPGQSAFPSGAYRLQNPVAVLHTNHDSADMVKGDFESFKVIEVRGKWFVHQRVELNAILPFQMTRSMMHSSLEKISGMGDATFFVGLHAIRRTESKVKQRLVVGLGVKI
ncbi:MAG TPA: hypothetical protein VK826_17380, partial [Bacteroidia bacterium]|nr:hypothetical protein [Bacteroidia bacterium]